MDLQTALKAMRDGSKVRAVFNGRTYEGTFDGYWTMALTRFGWERYSPQNVPADAIKVGTTLFDVRFYLTTPDGQKTYLTSTVQVEPADVELA